MPHAFDPSAYGPAIGDLFADDRLAPLGPGAPNLAARPKLAALTAPTMFAPRAVADPDMARACLAGLWLHHDFLDESHTICQDIDTPTGSYWHALLHRREPDAANAMYWFRRVGRHLVLQQLAKLAPSLGYDYRSPQQFVDFCERTRDSGTADEALAKHVQRLEWQLLFDHCYRAAIVPAPGPTSPPRDEFQPPRP